MAQFKQFSFTYFKHLIIRKGKSLCSMSLGIAQTMKSMYPENLASIILFSHESMLKVKYNQIFTDCAKVFEKIFFPEVFKDSVHLF